MDFLRQRVPNYMVPTQYFFIDEFPLNSNGKIDRNALLKLAKSHSILESKTIIEARTDLEKKLLEIWKDVLGVENIGIDDDLFTLGGDSVKSIQIVSRINKAGIWVTLKQVLQSLTVSKLAEAIASNNSMREEKIAQLTPGLTVDKEKWYVVKVSIVTFD